MDGYPVKALTDLLEQVDAKLCLLTGLVYHLGKENEGIYSKHLQILCNPEEIEAYVSRADHDLIIMTRPDQIAVIIKRTDAGREERTGELMQWLLEQGDSEMLIIAVA